ncbi:MAG: hypothetical protein GXY03_10480 [Solirubrobacterales bacterium]|nr:hypothetical protein [Solirubrobacterales bacterium]
MDPMRVRASIALTVLAVVLGLTGMGAGYVSWRLAEPEPFADSAVAALQSREVRVAVSEQVTLALLERGSPDLVAWRPLVLSAVEAVLETDRFERVLRRSAFAAHEVLFEGQRDVVLELEQTRDVLVPAIEAVAPEVAREIPEEISPRVAEVRSSTAATTVVRAADSASAAAIPLLLAALAALVAALWLAPDRRRAVVRVGVALAAGGALALVALAALRAQVVGRAEVVGVLSEQDARAAAGAAWDAFMGDLQGWVLAAGLAGLALAGGMLIAEARVDRAKALRDAVGVVAGGTLPRWAHLLRGLGLAAVGALILLGVEPLLGAAVVTLGGLLAVLGLAEALSVGAAGPARRSGSERGAGAPGAAPRGPRRRRVLLAAGGSAAAVAAVAVALLLATGGPGAPDPPAPEAIAACNGSPALCDRRLDEVVFAGTHNSMSAADRPGWFFANQRRPIPRQLADGIRLLMIDPHYGVVDAQGRVRTDLAREGTTRNRVAGELGVDAVRAAERLAGRLDLVPADGDREVFLCHTLCELGAERMGSTLTELRGFLERNPTEVVVVYLESSVDPADVEAEFEDAGLEPYLAELPRDGELPTLRELIASGERLIVLDEDDGGDAPWYQPAFLFLRDTRIDTLLEPGTACEPARGTPESPLLLLNHWVDRFPPPPSANRAVAGRETLLRRVRACRDRLGRTPNMIAVDFYGSGDLLAVVDELNRAGLRPRSKGADE